MREPPCERSAPRLPCASNGRRSCHRRAYTYQPTFFYRRCERRSQFARPSIAWRALYCSIKERSIDPGENPKTSGRSGSCRRDQFLPLPHPKHQEGGFVFPRFLIDEIKRQEGRDLTRFDVDYDIPDHFLPEFPPALYLHKRTDLGDVSQGKRVTIEIYYALFNGILATKQIEGVRLLVTPFPQQQFNE